MKEILEILQKRVTNAFNDCGNSYPVIDAEEDDLKELTAELSQLIDLRKELIKIKEIVKNQVGKKQPSEFKLLTNYYPNDAKDQIDDIFIIIYKYLASRPDSKAISDAGQREEKPTLESDQSKLISKYEELVEHYKAYHDSTISPAVKISDYNKWNEYGMQLESDIAELKTKTE